MHLISHALYIYFFGKKMYIRYILDIQNRIVKNYFLKLHLAGKIIFKVSVP